MYLDDILVSAPTPCLVRLALSRIVHKPQAAGFIISPKSETTPVPRMTFNGKRIDCRRATISNSPQAVAVALRIWLRGLGQGGISPHELSRLLGRLQWLARPGVGSAPSLAGAYRQMYSGRSHFTRAMARSLATAIVCDVPPVQLLHRPHTKTHTFFSDAAEAHDAFRVRVVGAPGCYGTSITPPWVNSLQQAKLYAAYCAVKVAVYKGSRSVAVRVDNDAARAQLSSVSATTACRAQQRILRRFFWLRAWSGVRLHFFGVPSPYNPADPLSRIQDFPRWSSVTKAAEHHCQSWGMSPEPFQGFQVSRPSTGVWV